MRSMQLLVPFVLACAALCAAPSAGHAQAKTYKVDGSASQIQFVSDAPLEKFTGTLNKASGELKVDANNVASTKGTVKVDIDSIKTGIDLRDEHVKADNWLDAKKYPQAEFVISKVSGAEKLKAGEAVEVSVSGKFSLHGVAKDVTTKAKVRLIPAEGGKPEAVRVVGTFTIKLEDHKVSIPSIVALKVSPDIVVNIDIRANAE